MRIIFAGTPINAALTLEALVLAGFNVVGALTRKDAQVGRKKTITETAVSAVATKHGIDVFRANSISTEAQSWIDGKKADLGVIVAYGNILKKPVLDSPTNGWINVHYSLLPEFPGAAPVQHAILEGKSVTGVSVFRLDEGVDTGPILRTREHAIGPDLTSGELLAQLTVVGSELLIETLGDLERSFAGQMQQPKSVKPRVAGKLTRPDAKIDFSNSVVDVHNFIRAMNPEPMAWFEINSLAIRVLSSALSSQLNIPDGELVIRDGELLVGAQGGALRLLRVQPAGKNEMAGADWFRGLKQDSIRVS
jgi:methionyl-tRNA formyltransferase